MGVLCDVGHYGVLPEVGGLNVFAERSRSVKAFQMKILYVELIILL
jgi:hypothetical protein